MNNGQNAVCHNVIPTIKAKPRPVFMIKCMRQAKCKLLQVGINITQFNAVKIQMLLILMRESLIGKRTARAVLTVMCYSVGSAMRQGSSSLTRLTGQSAMTPGTWRR